MICNVIAIKILTALDKLNKWLDIFYTNFYHLNKEFKQVFFYFAKTLRS